MPANPGIIDTAGFESWFNDTKYLLQDRIDTEMKNPIFDLLGEITDPSRANVISTTGRDNVRTGKTKAENAQVSPETPVEEDQGTSHFLTFEASQVISYESLVHDQYKYSEDDPAELVDNVFRGVSRLLHSALFNASTATTVTLPGSGGAYSLALPNGQAMFSTSQSGPGYSGKSNYYNSDLAFSNDAVGTVTNYAIQNFVYSTGERKPFQPNLIIVPQNGIMVEAAVQNTMSTLVPATGNNSINYFKGRMDVAELIHAPETPATGAFNTSTQYNWILANKQELKKSLKYKFIERPRVLTKFLDPDTGASKITVLCRVAVVPKRWQWGVRVNATTAPTHPGAI